jgi:hypothetical protein
MVQAAPVSLALPCFERMRFPLPLRSTAAALRLPGVLRLRVANSHHGAVQRISFFTSMSGSTPLRGWESFLLLLLFSVDCELVSLN